MPDLKKMLTLEALSEALPSWLKRSTKPEYNADEIDSTLTTNQFVTASDKDNWNAKGTYSKPPGGIPKSDLSSIVQTSLEKADSALQSETDPTVPSWAKQTNKPSYTQDEVPDGSTYKRVTQTEKDTWSGKQNALTTPQMRAVNSGITSEKVTQISTNQTNILSVLNRTGKNVANIQAPASTRGCTFTTGNNGAVTITNTENWSQFIVANVRVKPNTQYKLIFYTDAISNLPAFDVYPRDHDTDGSSLGANFRVSNTGTIVKDFTSISDVLSLNIYPNNQATTVSGTATFRVMVCEKTLYDLSNEYTWGIPNYDLTYLQAEDRAALAEEIDAGAKNKLKNNSYTCTGSPGRYGRDDSLSIPAGDYVLIAKLNQAQNVALTLVWDGIQHDFNANGSFSNTIKTWNVHATNTITSAWIYFNGTNDTWTEVMLCTKAAFGVSNKFVPYRPSYDDLIAQSTYTTSTSSTSITNLLYNAANTLGISPTNINFFVVSVYSDASDCLVICGAYKHGTIGYGVSMASRNITFEGTVNNLGTVGWTGGTAPYHVKVRFF